MSAIVTYSDGNVVEVAAVTVDTEIEIMNITIPSNQGGTIKKIHYSCTAATASNGYLELKLSNHIGPYRFAIPNAGADQITLLCGTLEVDIPVIANEVVKGYMTLNVAGVDAMMSIEWVK